jgi:hypothetical protein
MHMLLHPASPLDETRLGKARRAGSGESADILLGGRER